MAAAAGDSMQQRIADIQADIGEAKQQLQGATGDKEVALQQRLAALEQQKLLLMQQQSAAAGGAGGELRTPADDLAALVDSVVLACKRAGSSFLGHVHKIKGQ